MKDSQVAKQRTRLASLKNAAIQGKSRADALAAQTSTDNYIKYLLGEIELVNPINSRAEYLREYKKFAPKNEAAISALKQQASELPHAVGQNWYSERKTRVGIIADEFLYESLKIAADFVPLTPTNFRDKISEVDCVLIVSAWRGLKDEWFGVAQKKSPKRALLESELIPLARSLDTPVIFYSKEDPPNYKNFLSIAQLADAVFTSAEEMIPRYQKDIGEAIPIEAIRFGVNFEVHNPLGCMRHNGREIVFAGSWLRHKYPERAEAAAKIFDGIKQSDLPFYLVDRNLELDARKVKKQERYMFPDEYVPNLHRPIAHHELQRIQKLLPVAVNLNSVTDSQTMFANRVVELLAMGTLVLSNYSAGVNTLYPMVTILDSTIDTKHFLQRLTPDYLKLCQVEGIREVFLSDTAFERVDQLLSSVGIQAPGNIHKIYVVAESEDQFEDFARSQINDHPLQYVAQGEEDSLVGSAGGDIVLTLSKLSVAGPNIVDDIICAYRYSSPDVLFIEPIDSDVTAYEPFVSSARAKESAPVLWLGAGETVDSLDSTSALTIHTTAFKRGRVARDEAEKEISVVVPIYNNGKHLVHKCFQSLYRSSIFEKSQILLIDDGSTDLKTKAAVTYLENAHPNVSVFRFPEGGSGSASRPRNKGLELCKTPRITYLDPDNEHVNDGFSTLLDMVDADGTDFAIGNMIRFKGVRSTVNNARFLKNALAKAPAPSGQNKDLLRILNYKPMSIQALVADTRWLKSLGITQPLGAVGQDTYFFQQMLYYANSLSITTLPIHIYYAEISGSTVNTVSPRFYRKYLPLERSRSEWLSSIGLLTHYQEHRFAEFLEHWYAAKLQNVSASEFDECMALIEEIIRIYDLNPDTEPEINRILHEAKAIRVQRE